MVQIMTIGHMQCVVFSNGESRVNILLETKINYHKNDKETNEAFFS